MIFPCKICGKRISATEPEKAREMLIDGKVERGFARCGHCEAMHRWPSGELFSAAVKSRMNTGSGK